MINFVPEFDPQTGKVRIVQDGTVYELKAEKGAADGYAPLDSSSLIPLVYIPQGAGSGLDADTVDGFHLSQLALVGHTHEHHDLNGLGDDDHTIYLLVDGTRSMTGDLNMGSNRIQALSTPINGSDAATKAYVDAFVMGLDWKESVLDRDLTNPPGSPSTGDRYLVASPAGGLWVGREETIAEYTGSAWIFIEPTEGATVWVEDEGKYCTYTGGDHPAGTWVTFGSTLDHGSLLGLTDLEDHPGYLDLGGTRTMTGNLDMGSNPVINATSYNGVVVESHASRHIDGGADELDGDTLDITFSPTNYTPDSGIVEANDVGDLAAHLKGIDTELSAIALEGKVRDYQFSGDIDVPESGILYLKYGTVPTSAAPLVINENATLLGGSISVDLADSSRTYRVEVLVNDVVEEFITLNTLFSSAQSTSFSTNVSAGDEVKVRMSQFSGTGKSTFRNIAVSLELQELV